VRETHGPGLHSQQLGDDGNGDVGRVLAGLQQADRRYQPLELRAGKSLPREARPELRRLGLGSDQAEESAVVSPQRALDQVEVERVTVRHH